MRGCCLEGKLEEGSLAVHCTHNSCWCWCVVVCGVRAVKVGQKEVLQLYTYRTGWKEGRRDRGGGSSRGSRSGNWMLLSIPTDRQASLLGLLGRLVAGLPVCQTRITSDTSGWLPRRRSQQYNPIATLLQTVESWWLRRDSLKASLASLWPRPV